MMAMTRVTIEWNDDPEASDDVTIIRRSLPTPAREAVRVEVDLDAIVNNARAFQESIGIGTGVLAVLKSNACGHGLVQVAMALHHGGNITGLVVDTVADAFTLAGLRIERAIICEPTAWDGRFAEIIHRGIVPVIGSARDLRCFAHAARRSDLTCAIHVVVDRTTDLDAMLAALGRAPELRVTGLTGDAVDSAVRGRFFAAGHHPATFGGPGSDHVRAGLALFEGALRLVSRIAQLRSLAVGDMLGDAWRASRPSVIATLPLGHAHGYPRRLVGKPEVLVSGMFCPVVGPVGAEMMHVDVTDLMLPILGDEVVVFGDQGRETILLQDLAASPEETFAGLARATPRDYVRHPRRRIDAGPASLKSDDLFAVV